MPEELVLDFHSEVPKRKSRATAKNKAKYWDVRYGALLKDGFTDEEAAWAANNGISLKAKGIPAVRVHRRAAVKWYMTRYGYTRFKAIEMASKDLDNNLKEYGGEAHNIFFEKYEVIQ
jgi:hypothetical protein